MRTISQDSAAGYFRFLLVEGTRDLDDTIRSLEARLEESRLLLPDGRAELFIEHFSG